MSAGSAPLSAQLDQARAIAPVAALVVAVVAVATKPASAGDLVLVTVPVAAFAVWALVRRVPVAALTIVVVAAVVPALSDGDPEPLMFQLCLLAFVIGVWAPSPAAAIALGLLAVAAPVAAALLQDPHEIAVGVWVMGVVFPWVVGRVLARQSRLAVELDASRRELAEQALLEERRRIARDVHDFVGHGLAAVMLQVTSARHVLRRDPDAAEEALRSAEEVGRRSMQELRRTVGLLRRGDDAEVDPPLQATDSIAALVEQAQAGGLAVELRTRGDLDAIAPSVGIALYRISQEALANAARHAPKARTVLDMDVRDGHVSLVAETTGPTLAPEPRRARYGLVGMRERANALGGELDAGPTPEGWRLRCRLPLAGVREP